MVAKSESSLNAQTSASSLQQLSNVSFSEKAQPANGPIDKKTQWILSLIEFNPFVPPKHEPVVPEQAPQLTTDLVYCGIVKYYDHWDISLQETGAKKQSWWISTHQSNERCPYAFEGFDMENHLLTLRNIQTGELLLVQKKQEEGMAKQETLHRTFMPHMDDEDDFDSLLDE